MAGLGLHLAVLVNLGLTLLVHLKHLISVSVVCGDDSNAAKLVDNGQDSAKLEVKCLHGATGCSERTGVTDHVAVGEVHAQALELAGTQAVDEGCR